MATKHIRKEIHRDADGNITHVEEVHPDGCGCQSCAPKASELAEDPRIDVLLAEVEHLKQADEDRRQDIRRLEEEKAEQAAMINYFEEREQRRAQLVLEQRERALALAESGREPSPAEKELLALSEQLEVADLHLRQKHGIRRDAIVLTVNDRGVYATPARRGR